MRDDWAEDALKRPSHSTFLFAALLACAALLTQACSFFRSERACGSKPDLVVFVLYDLSGSVGKQRAEYEQESFRMLDSLYDLQQSRRLNYKPEFQGETLFAADLITANSLAFAQTPVHACFPAFGLTSSFEKYKKQCRQSAEQARQEVSRVLARDDPSQQTDIFNALLLAHKVLFSETAATAKSKYLILFSDMVHETSTFNFTREPLTDARIGTILGAEQKAGRIPDLTGVKVWVAGAGGSSDARMTGPRLLWVQRFWLRYFQAAHADLSDARYAGTLIDFHLPQP